MSNPISDLLTKAADKLFPDVKDRQAFEIRLEELKQSGDFRELDHRYDAILAEANSSDKWTSRARPSFMYVMYIMILTGIPYGVWFAAHPESAQNMAAGLKAWIEAIPEAMWTTFTITFTGYAIGRSYEKGLEIKHRK